MKFWLFVSAGWIALSLSSSAFAGHGSEHICRLAGGTHFEWLCGSYRCFACDFADGEDIICTRDPRGRPDCRLGTIFGTKIRYAKPPFKVRDVKRLQKMKQALKKQPRR